jgi:uncharacterized protein YydD (DUF2326 family)
MFLKSLTLSSDAHIIREIRFHRGLNLIVDETPSGSGQETGNNVGKTTVLMLVDFCFGADPKDIYTDPEHKRVEYKLVKDFLIENRILVTLVLKDDLSDDNSHEVVIERNFLSRKNKIQRVDGFENNDKPFEESLTDILFPGHYGKKPTIRQIISHNIRYKDLRINNTLKILDRYTRDDEYETLYLFLFGCDFEHGDTKQELREKLGIEEKFKRRLEKDQTKSAYESALAILDSEIAALEAQKASFNLNETFEDDLNQLNQVKYKINRTASEITKLNIRRDLITQAQQELNASRSNADLQQLEQIYRQAKAQIDTIQKTFAELQQFHNRMITEKVKFIIKDLPKLESDISSQNEKLKQLLKEEEALGEQIARGESFEELEKLISALNEKYRQKGEFENTINQLNEVDSNLLELGKRLNEIDDALFSDESEQRIKDQVNKFNRFFSSISHALYGEKYALKVDPKIKKGKRLYEFSAFNTNFSSGKKQGEISSFDIAYTLFADQENIPCMHFLLNDKKELMHDNQLIKIAQLVNNEGIQFIASILKDKLPDELNQESYFVLKLSQTEKLFLIERDQWRQ